MSLHADHVLAALGAGGAASSSTVASWQRSVALHGLDPDSKAGPERDEAGLREALQRDATLIAAADPFLDGLFEALGDPEGSVLLADRTGLTLSLRHGRSHDIWKRRPAHWLGSDVSERRLGTNGTGTCLAEERPVAVRGEDHFLAVLTATACYAAPIFSPDGTLAGCINVLTMRVGEARKTFDTLVRMSVAAAARSVEIEVFAAAFPDARLVLAAPDGRHPNAILAIDRDDLIVGATRRARQLLELTDREIRGGVDLDTLSGRPPAGRLAETERKLIARVLARHGGNVSAAAKEVGISRSTLYRKLRPSRH